MAYVAPDKDLLAAAMNYRQVSRARDAEFVARNTGALADVRGGMTAAEALAAHGPKAKGLSAAERVELMSQLGGLEDADAKERVASTKAGAERAKARGAVLSDLIKAAQAITTTGQGESGQSSRAVLGAVSDLQKQYDENISAAYTGELSEPTKTALAKFRQANDDALSKAAMGSPTPLMFAGELLTFANSIVDPKERALALMSLGAATGADVPQIIRDAAANEADSALSTQGRIALQQLEDGMRQVDDAFRKSGRSLSVLNPETGQMEPLEQSLKARNDLQQKIQGNKYGYGIGLDKAFAGFEGGLEGMVALQKRLEAGEDVTDEEFEAAKSAAEEAAGVEGEASEESGEGADEDLGEDADKIKKPGGDQSSRDAMRRRIEAMLDDSDEPVVQEQKRLIMESPEFDTYARNLLNLSKEAALTNAQKTLAFRNLMQKQLQTDRASRKDAQTALRGGVSTGSPGTDPTEVAEVAEGDVAEEPSGAAAAMLGAQETGGARSEGPGARRALKGALANHERLRDPPGADLNRGRAAVAANPNPVNKMMNDIANPPGTPKPGGVTPKTDVSSMAKDAFSKEAPGTPPQVEAYPENPKLAAVMARLESPEPKPVVDMDEVMGETPRVIEARKRAARIGAVTDRLLAPTE